MIPPFIQQILGTLVRALVVWLAGVLAARGIVVSDDQTMQVVAWLTPLVATLAWSLWQKFRGRQKLLTALGASKIMTEAEVEKRVADPGVPTPSVLTPKTEIPT